MSDRAIAIKVTNEVLANLTPEKANQIFCEECELQVDFLNTYIWSEYNVQGWYYDENDSCFDLIRYQYIAKAIEFAATNNILGQQKNKSNI